MKTMMFIALAVLLPALSGCSALHWSGHPTHVSFSGTGPGPLQPTVPEKEVKPFIAKMPVTYEEYTQAARLYLDLAEKYRQEAASHQAMKRIYGDKDPEMAAHCDLLSRQLLDLAAQCEEIGKAHEKKAEALKILK